MRRSRRTLFFALTAALVALAAVPLALAGAPADDQYGGGDGPPQGAENDGGENASSGGASTSDSGDSDSDGSSRRDRDCSDFSSQQDAQSTYVNQDGDPDNLDADNDGSACEDFDYGDTIDEDNVTDASFDEYPREGIASGGGSTAAGGMSPLPLLVSAGAFGLLAAGSWGVTLRRRLGK